MSSTSDEHAEQVEYRGPYRMTPTNGKTITLRVETKGTTMTDTPSLAEKIRNIKLHPASPDPIISRVEASAFRVALAHAADLAREHDAKLQEIITEHRESRAILNELNEVIGPDDLMTMQSYGECVATYKAKLQAAEQARDQWKEAHRCAESEVLKEIKGKDRLREQLVEVRKVATQCLIDMEALRSQPARPVHVLASQARALNADLRSTHKQLAEANESLARVRRLASEDSMAEYQKRVAAEQEAEQARRERDEASSSCEMYHDLADGLRDENQKLRRALEPFAKFAEADQSDIGLGAKPDYVWLCPSPGYPKVKMQHFLDARAALQGGEAGQVSDEHKHCNHHHALDAEHQVVDFGDGEFVANNEAVPLLKALNEIGLRTRTHHIGKEDRAFVSILLDNVEFEVRTVDERNAGRTKYNGKTELLISWDKPQETGQVEGEQMLEANRDAVMKDAAENTRRLTGQDVIGGGPMYTPTPQEAGQVEGACPFCDGKGVHRISKTRCNTCRGTGEVLKCVKETAPKATPLDCNLCQGGPCRKPEPAPEIDPLDTKLDPAVTDDAGVDRFAEAMKRKLAEKRAEGRGGWNDPWECSGDFLRDLLREHVGKGDPVDVGNLAMMLFCRGQSTKSDDPPEAGQGACVACESDVQRYETEVLYAHLKAVLAHDDETVILHRENKPGGCMFMMVDEEALDDAKFALAHLNGYDSTDTPTPTPPAQPDMSRIPVACIFNEGDTVEKTTGDYTFKGDVRAVCKKRSGQVRYVVENDAGILHIFSGKQLTCVARADATPSKQEDE